MKENPEIPRVPAGKYTRVIIQGEHYGIKASRVRGVVKKPGVRRVPGAPSFIEGVTALDGRIVPVLNPVIRLALSRETSRTPSDQPSNDGLSLLMVEIGNVLYGLTVDQVLDIRDFPASAMEPVNPVIRHNDFPFIAAMAKTGTKKEQLIYLLNIDDVIFSGLDIRKKAREQYDHFSGRLKDKLTPHVARTETKYLIFSTGRERLGIASSQLKSVYPISLVAQLPDTGRHGPAGLLTTDNGTLPVLNLAQKIGMDQAPAPRDGQVVVVSGPYSYGLLVDEVKEFLRLAPEQIKPVPAGMGPGETAHIKGFVMAEDNKGIITLLHASKLLSDQEINDFSQREDIQMTPLPPQTDHTPQADLVPLLLTGVADMRFAVPIDAVSQVIRIDDVKPVPRAPSHIRGLITVRGEPLPLMHLHRRLNMETALPAGPEQKNRAVVIQTETLSFAVEVDEVSGIVKVSRDKLTALPEIIRNVDTRFLSGLVLLDETDQSAMVLDVDALMDREK